MRDYKKKKEGMGLKDFIGVLVACFKPPPQKPLL
jgi:hypothetical protein